MWQVPKWITSLIVLTSCLAGVEAEQTRPDRQNRQPTAPSDFFQRFDSNGDGAIAIDEFPERIRRIAKQLDRNGDGKVTREEFTKARQRPDSYRRPYRRPGESRPDGKGKSDRSGVGSGRPGEGKPEVGQFFSRLDRNGDGKISKDEIPSQLPQPSRDFLNQADSSGDGLITKEELAAAHKKMESLGRKPETPGSPKPDPGQGRRLDVGRIFGHLDTNGDGQLAKDEIPEKMRQNFDRIDADASGTVSKKELQKVFEMMQRYTGAGRGRSFGARTPRQIFNEQDSDADGRVTRQEAKATLAKQFEELDTNGDGKLDVREVENGLE